MSLFPDIHRAERLKAIYTDNRDMFRAYELCMPQQDREREDGNRCAIHNFPRIEKLSLVNNTD